MEQPHDDNSMLTAVRAALKACDGDVCLLVDIAEREHDRLRRMTNPTPDRTGGPKVMGGAGQ
jgi:hypothetical protein